MCTALLPPGVNPIAGNKYIISYHINSYHNYRPADNVIFFHVGPI